MSTKNKTANSLKASSILKVNPNITRELAPRDLHVTFGDPELKAKALQSDPDMYKRHPRSRYGKTRYDKLPPAARADAKAADKKRQRKAMAGITA